MTLTNAFYEAVATKNILHIRIMMEDSLLVDPSFEEFSEMEQLASNVEGLYDEHDGSPFVYDKALWNDGYMNKLMVKVLRNFSHERLNHLKDVIQYLIPVENIDKQEEQCYANSNSRSSKHNDNKSYQHNDGAANNHNKFIIVGAFVGGSVATMVGATTIGIIGGVLAGAVAGGVSAKTFRNK